MKTSLSRPPLHSHGRALAKVEGLNTTLSCDSGARVIRRIEAKSISKQHSTFNLSKGKYHSYMWIGLANHIYSRLGIEKIEKFILVVIHFRSQFLSR